MNTLEVDLHISCIIDQFYPQMGFNLVEVLKKAGVKVYYNEEQTCCGQMAFSEGFWNEAKRLGEKLISEFNNNRLVVGASPSCLGYIKTQFDELFYNGAFHNEYRQLQRNVFEITDFLVNVVKKTSFGAVFNHRVAFVNSCAAIKSYGQKDEPIQLLRNVEGLTLVNLENIENCSGFGGMFANRFEAIAVAMSKQIIDSALVAGVDYLVSNEPGILLHLDSYIKKNNIDLQTAHVVDVLVSTK
jgi:L-lactate dehydrogenase complex protein LldE